MTNFLDYFNFSLTFDEDVPKFSIKLKQEWKLGKEHPMRPSGVPYSGVQKEYYLHYFDEDLGLNLWEFRKSLCAKHKLILWWIDNFELDEETTSKLLLYRDKLSQKWSSKAKEYFNSPEGKAMMRVRSKTWNKRNAQNLHDRLRKNPQERLEWLKKRRDSGMYEKIANKCRDRHTDPEYLSWFTERMNDPSRTEKVSVAAKKMWENAKKHDKSKFYRMLTAPRKKIHEVSGYQMNSLEAMVATALNELGLDWVYEPLVEVDSHTYVPDFLVNDSVYIECFGDFWHANPSQFEPTDTTHKTRTASDIWKYDREKIRLLESTGKSVLVLWESEILEDSNKFIRLIKENV